jgi:hypothetical protein
MDGEIVKPSKPTRLSPHPPELGAARRKREGGGGRGGWKLPRPRGLPGYHSRPTARAPPPLSSSTPDVNHMLQSLRRPHVHRSSHPRFTVCHVTYVSHTAGHHIAAKAIVCIMCAARARSGLQVPQEPTSLHQEGRGGRGGGGGVVEATHPTGCPSRTTHCLAERDRHIALNASRGWRGGGATEAQGIPGRPLRSTTQHAISHTSSPPRI